MAEIRSLQAKKTKVAWSHPTSAPCGCAHGMIDRRTFMTRLAGLGPLGDEAPLRQTLYIAGN
jgi:hypothetical protein